MKNLFTKFTTINLTTIIVICLLNGFFISNLFAQDTHYSQYYAAPLYLNPAFTGTIQGHRIVANYRNQWPNIPRAFETYSVSYDFNVKELRSGFGVIATTDKAGSAGLRSTTLGFIYSYKIQLAEKWMMTPAIQFTYGNRNIDFNKLVFGDQLILNGPTQDDAMSKFDAVNFYDFSTGLLIYNKAFWFGYSLHHLNSPNLSLINDVSTVPKKHSIHTGIKIPLNNGPFKKSHETAVAPSLVYRTQGSFDQLDVGMHYLNYPMVLGLWYRGIPIQQDVKDNMSHDAMTIVLGLKKDIFEIGYSYDLTISDLGGNPGGAHEISLIMEIKNTNMKKHKPDKFIPCPAIYNKGLIK